MGRACCCGASGFIFFQLIARHVVGISVGIRSYQRLKLLQIQSVMELGGYRPGAADQDGAGLSLSDRHEVSAES